MKNNNKIAITITVATTININTTHYKIIHNINNLLSRPSSVTKKKGQRLSKPLPILSGGSLLNS